MVFSSRSARGVAADQGRRMQPRLQLAESQGIWHNADKVFGASSRWKTTAIFSGWGGDQEPTMAPSPVLSPPNFASSHPSQAVAPRPKVGPGATVGETGYGVSSRGHSVHPGGGPAGSPAGSPGHLPEHSVHPGGGPAGSPAGSPRHLPG